MKLSVFVMVLVLISSQLAFAQNSNNGQDNQVHADSLAIGKVEILDVNETAVETVKVKQQIHLGFSLINQNRDQGYIAVTAINDTYGKVIGSKTRGFINANQSVILSQPFVLVKPGSYTSQVMLYDRTLEHQLHQPITVNISVSNDGYIAPDPSNPTCVYDLSGNSFSSSPSCAKQGTPSIISKINGVSQFDFQNILDWDKKIFLLQLMDSQCPGCSESYMSQYCTYTNSGDWISSYSEAQKIVLSDLRQNYSLFVCPDHNTFKNNPIVKSPSTVSSHPKSDCSPGTIIQNDTCVSTNRPVEYFIEHKIVKTQNYDGNHSVSVKMPLWIKNAIDWWKNGKISNLEFSAEIQYLADKGILKIS